MRKFRERKDEWVKGLKVAAFILLILSIAYLIVQAIWEEASNSTIAGFASGYFASYLVYVLTIWLPGKIKSAEAVKIVSEELRYIHNRGTLTLLLAYKNTCTMEEWEHVKEKASDEACYDEQFYTVMRKFDVTAKADSLIARKEDSQTIKWFENIDSIFNDISESLKSIVTRYNQILPSRYMEVIYGLQGSALLCLFTGEHKNMIFISTGKDGYKYFDDFPAKLLYESGQYGTIIFGETDKGDNADMLRDFISGLNALKSELSKQCGTNFIPNDFAIAKLKANNAGHIHTAAIK